MRRLPPIQQCRGDLHRIHFSASFGKFFVDFRKGIDNFTFAKLKIGIILSFSKFDLDYNSIMAVGAQKFFLRFFFAPASRPTVRSFSDDSTSADERRSQT